MIGHDSSAPVFGRSSAIHKKELPGRCTSISLICSQFHISYPFPVSESNLIRFVAFHYESRLAGATVKNYLAAIRYTQIALGLGDPQLSNLPRLEYVVKGFKRSATYATCRTRLPITPDILCQSKRVWQGWQNCRDASMLWAAVTMCFCGFLRSGEVVVPSPSSFDPSLHLCYGDVMVDSNDTPSIVQIRIKISKTDPFRKGIFVYLGVTGGSLCPVAAVLDFMVRRGPGEGPFFTFANGSFLTRDRFVQAVREALSCAGVDSSAYAGHSFRIGAATTAARRGIPDSMIKMLGRWESSAYTVYIRTPRETLASISKVLVADVS